jgi:hypothetical protein
VSSTFRDLELERQEVMHALLELDCMPSGMELFPAAILSALTNSFVSKNSGKRDFAEVVFPAPLGPAIMWSSLFWDIFVIKS